MALPIESARLLDFIGGADLAVVFMSLHPVHAFNECLCEHFVEQQGKRVTFGVVNLRDLVTTPNAPLPFLHQSLRACGVPSAFGVLPGYWLFSEGALLAWNSGLPRAVDAGSIARGSWLAAVWSGFTGRTSFVVQALHTGAKEATARRVAACFRQAVEAGLHDQPRASAWQRPPTPDEELARAYETLAVSPQATDQEVKEAWRQRRREVHPDQHAHDPNLFERLSQRSALINHARDVIFAHRRRWQN